MDLVFTHSAELTQEMLTKITERIALSGKESLSDGKWFPPTCVIVSDKEIEVECLKFESFSEKVEAFERVNQRAKELNAQAVITVMDAFYVRIETKGDKLKEEDMPLPSASPDRRESIIAVCNTASGAAYMLFYPYRREGGKIVWEEREPEHLGKWSGKESKLKNNRISFGESVDDEYTM